jgi:hypothetical protein
LLESGWQRRHVRSDASRNTPEVQLAAIAITAPASVTASTQDGGHANDKEDDYRQESDGAADDDWGGVSFGPAAEEAVEWAFGSG